MNPCGNIYCQKLSTSERRIICRFCRQQKIQSGRYLEISPTDSSFMLQLNGLSADYFYRKDQRITLSIHSASDCPDAIFLFCPDSQPRQRLFLTDTTVLLWSRTQWMQLAEQSIQGHRLLLQMLSCEYAQLESYYRNVLSASSRDALTWIDQYCQKNSIPPLTHEQLAFITNHNRVTITKLRKEQTYGTNKSRK